MSKRKREDDLEDWISEIDDQALRIRVSRLKARFDHGVQQLTAQLRLARGFDRQKMTRRLKQAGSDKVKLERLQAEVKFLNNIKEADIARNHLLKQCVRTKRINESEAFQVMFEKDAGKKTKASPSIAEGNVLGRLFKSNPASEVIPGIMKGIREVLDVDGPPAGSRQRREELQKGGINEKNSSRISDDDDFNGFSDDAKSQTTSTLRNSSSAGDGAEESSASDLEEPLMEAYISRLAASSDEDNDDIEGQSHDKNQDPMDITTDEEGMSSDELISEPGEALYPSETENDGQNIESKVQKRTKPKQTSPQPTTQTSFLPSLMHGGYYSGSDTDDEQPGDYDPDKSFAASQPRKNRRGQRERQAIAEKKHGVKAKHLLKAKGAEGVHGDRQKMIANNNAGFKGRSDGWDARRGAVDQSRMARGKDGWRHTSAPNRAERRNGTAKDKVRAMTSTGANSDPVRGIARTMKPIASGKNEKLHPSWEAARKKKLESANAGASAFVGKKITFD